MLSGKLSALRWVLGDGWDTGYVRDSRLELGFFAKTLRALDVRLADPNRSGSGLRQAKRGRPVWSSLTPGAKTDSLSLGYREADSK